MARSENALGESRGPRHQPGRPIGVLRQYDGTNNPPTCDAEAQVCRFLQTARGVIPLSIG